MPTAKPTGQMVGVGECALFPSPCGSSTPSSAARPRRVYETDYTDAAAVVSTTWQLQQGRLDPEEF
jgi:hypothetical protein